MPDEPIALTGELKKWLLNDPFPRSLGVEIMELRPGYSRVRLKVTEQMTNIHGITHGGIIFTVADVAFGTASNSHGVPAVGINMNINYLKKSIPGDELVATAREENLTRRTGLYRITVENQHGELVAVASGLVYRRSR
ncbi:hydroxyphenylacetyl-CoA thioesterase PaaI [Desulfofundulus thermobenzoicus]|uniref:Hydroxyphenylacetyl-CoA thioesterase PaaI n=1 Tax=Desulfofundulus thermobenzoicus TaxID=29376 RepID=A0A6N7IR05_9FIRM|nr:hydroxyphenylacetyl-CoA thioesterase PaaI [Desulfofundulus thermobenzoicus]MQL52535.1 hydroxyphenylacetyl-CoA thioesterase PaaI [Desulfofundulus thermobenzoicus]